MPTSVKDMLAKAGAAVPRITPSEAADLIRDGKALVVDLREAAEVQESGKVKGALEVPRGLLEFRADPASPSHDPAFDPERTVIVYCASGGRSALGGKTLQELGFTDVRNLGGFKDWAQSGGAVAPADAPPAVSGGQQNADKAAESAPGPRQPGEDLARRQDQLLDEAVEETFPASDPISPKRIV